ncbi:MAG: beta-ketoacyl synthase N-terminal-like domain-containing protein [Dehalococcoidia bacterium]
MRAGVIEAALAGGAEALLASLMFAFAVIKAMSTANDRPERACRPFDRGRDGSSWRRGRRC